jgi:amidase
MTSPQVAFVPHTRVARARLREGALSGLSFAAKDTFAIRGHVSSAGHPDWARTHSPAERYAPLVEQLLGEGADLIGVTILDELAFGLSGINPHYGTPENPRASGRLCGGSSSGSAAAVAAALCDFSLATDTAGSVRVPAAFCGLLGIRATQGKLSMEGVVPLAPSFDAPGILARDTHTFASVGSVLFGAVETDPIDRVLIADDALALCDAGVPELLRDMVERTTKKLGIRTDLIEVAPEGFGEIAGAFGRLRAREIWHTHGEWITRVKPDFSAPVRARVEQCRILGESDHDDAADQRLRERLRVRVQRWLAPGTLLFIPPAPGIAPRLDASASELETFRARALELSSISAMTGVPQLVIPARALDDAPIALSFLAAHDQDGWLTQLAAQLDHALGT